MYSKQIFRIAIASLFVATITIFLLFIRKQNLIIKETVHIKPAIVITTNKLFSGGVNITISGYLTSLSTGATMDAFYVFDNTGNYDPVESISILNMNDHILLPPNHAGSAPPYSNDHIYTFFYFLGDDEQPIEFSLISDSFSGNIQIDVVTIPDYGGR